MRTLHDFVAESNRIEGIDREPLEQEVDAHAWFLDLDRADWTHLVEVAGTVANASIRSRPGMDVRVGNHLPPRGGLGIPKSLEAIFEDARSGRGTPYEIHVRYETLHPFMDGNGRTGRLLWLWMMQRGGQLERALSLGFLHAWYYQSLSEPRTGRDTVYVPPRGLLP